MSEKMDLELKKCRTQKFRVSFPYVFEPFENEDGKKEYRVTMLFKKSVDLAELKKIVYNAGKEKWGPKREKWPKFRYPVFVDGDEKEDLAEYAGNTVCSAKSKTKPGIVHIERDESGKRRAIEPEEFYPGCYAVAEVIASAYDNAGNKGIRLNLLNLIKVGDGPKLSGRKDASEAFDDLEYEAEEGGEEEADYEEGESDGAGF